MGTSSYVSPIYTTEVQVKARNNTFSTAKGYREFLIWLICWLHLTVQGLGSSAGVLITACSRKSQAIFFFTCRVNGCSVVASSTMYSACTVHTARSLVQFWDDFIKSVAVQSRLDIIISYNSQLLADFQRFNPEAYTLLTMNLLVKRPLWEAQFQVCSFVLNFNATANTNITPMGFVLARHFFFIMSTPNRTSSKQNILINYYIWLHVISTYISSIKFIHAFLCLCLQGL